MPGKNASQFLLITFKQRSRQLKRLILILQAAACTPLVASDTGALGGWTICACGALCMRGPFSRKFGLIALTSGNWLLVMLNYLEADR